jgi:hypothetical protein
MTVVTRNVKDFELAAIQVLDPFADLLPGRNAHG